MLKCPWSLIDCRASPVSSRSSWRATTTQNLYWSHSCETWLALLSNLFLHVCIVTCSAFLKFLIFCFFVLFDNLSFWYLLFADYCFILLLFFVCVWLFDCLCMHNTHILIIYIYVYNYIIYNYIYIYLLIVAYVVCMYDCMIVWLYVYIQLFIYVWFSHIKIKYTNIKHYIKI